IAIVVPVMVPVPPRKYGGIEQIVDELARGLGERGHKVTVFCSGGSTIAGKNIERWEASPYPTREHQAENRKWEIAEIETVLDRQDEFDAIHFNYEPIIFRTEHNGKEINLLDSFKKPAACTFHNITTISENIAYYRSAGSLYRHTMIFVSENQRSHVPFFPNSKVVYNAIPLERFPVEEHKENYLLFLGRIAPVKGILEAITVAEKTEIPLVIAAKVDPVDREFYEAEVMPRIDGKLVRYVGEVGFEEKIQYFKKAKCFLFPILWEEPFGLVMAEALACGTPVVAFRRGSVPEIVRDGINGYAVDTLDEMVAAVKMCGNISPDDCRKSVERFSISRMVGEYEDLFEKLGDKTTN
ncbi:MAG: glycosyltransferase family 4 protein, partial [Candidatus Liptonbacteria bacterium]|nr:glycosyltransferase family 4 protein [Candidatus Liptonbacteria bacterium]